MRSAVVVDYRAGNIASISNYLRHFEFRIEVSNDPKKIVEADLLVLPGVGSFGPAKLNLDRVGASDAIIERSRKERPTLGVCLGFQLMTLSSEESEGVVGLGLINATTKRLAGGPIIGWGRAFTANNSLGFTDAYYFNHSFGVFGSPDLEEVSFSGTESCMAFVRNGNLIGTQFHPEKSQLAGLDFFSNVVKEFWQDLR